MELINGREEPTDELLHVIQTFPGSGPSSTNLFRVYGIIKILFIYGIVETILNADVGNLSLDVKPSGTLVALTGTVASATAVAGSLFLKQTGYGNALVLASGATPYVVEPSDWKSPFISSIIGAKGDGEATYIRCTYSGNAASGAIDWHIEWRPLSDDGNVVVV